MQLFVDICMIKSSFHVLISIADRTTESFFQNVKTRKF